MVPLTWHLHWVSQLFASPVTSCSPSLRQSSSCAPPTVWGPSATCCRQHLSGGSSRWSCSCHAKYCCGHSSQSGSLYLLADCSCAAPALLQWCSCSCFWWAGWDQCRGGQGRAALTFLRHTSKAPPPTLRWHQNPGSRKLEVISLIVNRILKMWFKNWKLENILGKLNI